MILAGENWNYLEKNLLYCHYVKQKFHIDCHGICKNLQKLKCFTFCLFLCETCAYHAKSLLRKFCHKCRWLKLCKHNSCSVCLYKYVVFGLFSSLINYICFNISFTDLLRLYKLASCKCCLLIPNDGSGLRMTHFLMLCDIYSDIPF